MKGRAAGREWVDARKGVQLDCFQLAATSTSLRDVNREPEKRFLFLLINVKLRPRVSAFSGGEGAFDFERGVNELGGWRALLSFLPLLLPSFFAGRRCFLSWTWRASKPSLKKIQEWGERP